MNPPAEVTYGNESFLEALPAFGGGLAFLIIVVLLIAFAVISILMPLFVWGIYNRACSIERLLMNFDKDLETLAREARNNRKLLEHGIALIQERPESAETIKPNQSALY